MKIQHVIDVLGLKKVAGITHTYWSQKFGTSNYTFDLSEGMDHKWFTLRILGKNGFNVVFSDSGKLEEVLLSAKIDLKNRIKELQLIVNSLEKLDGEEEETGPREGKAP